MQDSRVDPISGGKGGFFFRSHLLIKPRSPSQRDHGAARWEPV